jgi:hypothetical protein
MRNFMNALETEILGLVQKKSDSLKKVIINSSLFKLLNSYNSKMKPLN